MSPKRRSARPIFTVLVYQSSASFNSPRMTHVSPSVAFNQYSSSAVFPAQTSSSVLRQRSRTSVARCRAIGVRPSRTASVAALMPG